MGAVDRTPRCDRHHLRRRDVSPKKTVKRLIAFSSVLYGLRNAGIATLTDFGINAAIFGMIAHGHHRNAFSFVAGKRALPRSKYLD